MHFINDIAQLCIPRSLDRFKEFKMREVHVFFLYYLYPVVVYALDHLDNGPLIAAAIRCKLLALHLTKGMSARVR